MYLVVLVVLIVALFATGCGPKDETRRRDNEDKPRLVESDTFASLTCSAGVNNTLECTNGQSIILPPAFPHSKDCNECITNVVNGIAKVKCPNGLNFEFPLIKGDKGDKGDTGAVGKDGKNGSSCSVAPDGWVKCTDGSSYKLLQGPKGDKGDKGVKGDSCTVAKNAIGQTVIKCEDGSEEVLSGCGGGGCWSYGAKGNVYTIPTSTTTIPNFSAMVPEETVKLDNFKEFNRQSSLGYPNMPHRLTWYGIQFKGFIELPACKDNRCYLRLTSDDGSRFTLGNCVIINNDGLHSPASKVGSVLATPGWHMYTFDYWQGPATQIATALELSVDGGVTYTVVPKDQLKYEIQ
jgi:hypothetical protein